MKDLFKELENYKSAEDKLKWSGTLKDYLELLEKKPHIHKSAHQRVLAMIESHGVERDGDDNIISYNFFKDNLFGVEKSIEDIMSYLRAAAAGSEVSRRILLMYGPTSSGKSQLAILLKRGLEEFSKTDEGAVYCLSDSPMFEDPLCAIPESMRPQVEKALNIKIQGTLNPYTSLILKDKYNGEFLKMPVERYIITEQDRKSIDVFVPSDKKSQDISELVGSMDLNAMVVYGSESDPRAYRWDGSLFRSNRGMIEFIEMLKCDQKFLYVLLTLAQEKNIKTGRFPLVFADEFICSHTNESEYRKFLAKDEMEALHDRIIVVRVPYNLKVEEEIKIYEKLISQADFSKIHIAPHTLRCAAIFAVLSRLRDSENKQLSLMAKLRLYNGEEVEGFSQNDVEKFQKEFDNEGMFGISPRYVINRLASKMADGETYVTPIDIIRSLRDGLSSNPKVDSKEVSRLETLLTFVIEEYNKLAKNDVQKAFFVRFEDEIDNLLSNYMDHIEAYLDHTKLKDEWGNFHAPDEKLMRSIEEKIGVTDSGKKSFRQEIYRKMLKSTKDNGGRYKYQEHPKLREALEKKLFDDRQDLIRLTVSSRNTNPEELKRINVVVETLCDKYGYNEQSANQLLRYVNSRLARG